MYTEIREKNGGRKALEWFVREKDEWYWKRTQRLLEKTGRKMATLAVASAAVSVASMLIFSRIYKS